METAIQEKARALAEDVLSLSRNRLTVDLRYMANPISMLQLMPAEGLDNMAVDGRRIIYDPRTVLRSYAEAPEVPVHRYLHLVMHCIYQHFYVSALVDRRLWDLASDIAVEQTIHEMALPFAAAPGDDRRAKALTKIQKKVPHMTAEVIYRYLADRGMSPAELREMQDLFSMDTHDVWYKEPTEPDNGQQDDQGGGGSEPDTKETGGGQNRKDGAPQDSADDAEDDSDDQQNSSGSGAPEGDGEDQDEDQQHNDSGGGGSPSGSGMNSQEEEQTSSGSEAARQYAEREQMRQEWKRAAEQMRMDVQMLSGKHQGTAPGSGFMDNLNYAVREKYDYETFLRQFGTIGEAMKINEEEFDYPFYCYGMERYGNMPLVEPLEYRDVRKVREFVIAIDTSGSTSGELVEMFLRKTYNILMQRDNFHSRVNVHIIQCDAEIQEDVKITNRAEFEHYMESMKVRGLGGTDFRPVFSHVDRLIREGELRNLKGLIYFTDGYGTFPSHQPAYKSAFVFVNDGFQDPEIPVWGIKLVLEPEDIEEIKV